MSVVRLDHAVFAVLEHRPGRFAYRIGETQLNVHGPGVSRGPGVSVYFRDPDGSLLEFMSYDKAS